jgi:hypothetical protein
MGFSLSPGDFFIPAFRCPHLVERIGTLGDGGKWVCGVDRVAKQDKCVIYSFGMLCFSFFFFCLFIASLPPFIFLLQYSIYAHVIMMCGRHQRRVVIRTRLVAARSQLRGVGI